MTLWQDSEAVLRHSQPWSHEKGRKGVFFVKKLWIALLMLPVLLGLSTCTTAKRVPDYASQLVDAVAEGETQRGYALAAERNALIARGVIREKPVSYDELLLLARLIDAETGESAYGEEYRLCVGEVALNRVASPEFPDTLEAVVFQQGQYPCAQEPEFADLRPSRACAEAALSLLLGERRLAPQVVYQSSRQIGPAFVRFYDRRLGYTYFCESVYPELYC